MLEHHQRLLSAQQQRIAELDWQIARESHYDGSKVAKGLGPTTFASLEREAIDWQRFQNRKQIGSYIDCCFHIEVRLERFCDGAIGGAEAEARRVRSQGHHDNC